MNAISIPKEITKGEELVVIPRKVYDRVLRMLSNKNPTGKVKLDRGLRQALNEVKSGKVRGPFTSVNEGLRFLHRSK